MTRPSFPTVVSLLALFIALGGTSYAVIKLPASSVGTRELKRNAVTGAKIRAGSVAASDLAAGVGVRGPRGPEGPAGAPGTAGGGGGVPGPWIPLTFQGSWTNYSSGFATGAYRKDQNGAVWLRGLVAKNGGTPTADEVIAQLPAGYRPSAILIFSVAMGAPNGYGRVDVNPAGEVMWKTGPTAENDFTALETIRFWPD